MYFFSITVLNVAATEYIMFIRHIDKVSQIAFSTLENILPIEKNIFNYSFFLNFASL